MTTNLKKFTEVCNIWNVFNVMQTEPNSQCFPEHLPRLPGSSLWSWFKLKYSTWFNLVCKVICPPVEALWLSDASIWSFSFISYQKTILFQLGSSFLQCTQSRDHAMLQKWAYTAHEANTAHNNRFFSLADFTRHSSLHLATVPGNNYDSHECQQLFLKFFSSQSLEEETGVIFS